MDRNLDGGPWAWREDDKVNVASLDRLDSMVVAMVAMVTGLRV